MSQPFNVFVRRQPGIATIDLQGEIHAFVDQELQAAYNEAVSEDPAIVMLNFKEVSYINSTGIALIVSLLAKARQSKRRMVVYGLSDHYLEIFQITRLSDFMDIYPDEVAALQAYKPGESLGNVR